MPSLTVVYLTFRQNPRFEWFVANKARFRDVIGNVHRLGMQEGRLLCIVGPERMRRILERMLAEDEFL